MSSNYSLDRDLKELAKMADAIKQYMHSDDLYMSVGGGFFGSSNMPQLTTGVLLLRIRRLNHFRDQMNASQIATLDKALEQYETARTEWAVHAEKKMVREGMSRLKAMNEFFRECRDSMKTCHNVYLPEALRRTLVQELLIAMDAQGLDTHEVITQSHKVDSELRRWVTAGDFIWSEELKPVYPADTFWWLYGRPDPGDL